MPFRLSQDPNSQHLGTTVWDASIVLAKYLEQVCDHTVTQMHTYSTPLQHAGKGEWSRAKLKTKRCIELGAGSGGLAGMVRLRTRIAPHGGTLSTPRHLPRWGVRR